MEFMDCYVSPKSGNTNLVFSEKKVSQEEVDSIIEQGIERARVEQEKRQQAVSEADTVTEAEPEEEPVEATMDAELLKNYLAKGGRPIGLW